MVRLQNWLVTWFLVVVGTCSACGPRGKFWRAERKNTYPGEMAVLSNFGLPIRIVDCQGLGSAQPGGIIVVKRTNDGYPQSRYAYPRLKSLPESVVIRWRSASQAEELTSAELRETDFQQRVALPANLKGTDGLLLFILDESNTWSCELRSASDPLEPYNHD